MSWIWLNMPFAVLMIAFTVGLPLWVIVKHPEGGATDASAAQVSPHAQPSASTADGEESAKAGRDTGRRAA